MQREQQLYSFWTEREDRVEKRRVEREDRLDAITAGSVQSVKNVLDVIHSTFEERRKSEEEGREATKNFNQKMKDLIETLEVLNGKIGTLEGFAASVRRTVEKLRRGSVLIES